MNIFIWGAGRVGRSIARKVESLNDPEMHLIGAWNRTFGRALSSSLLLECEVAAGDSLPETFVKADVIVLSVSDDVIAEMAGRLAPHLSARQILLHTSGALAADVAKVEGMRAAVGCCHPLQSLASESGSPELLDGITFGIDGDADAVEAAKHLARRLGGNPLELPSDKKVYYHLAAVVAANYTTVLSAMATLCAKEAGISTEDAVQMLRPLIFGTLANHEQHAAEGLHKALTGPIARGDLGTLRKHLKALRKMDKKAEALPARTLYAHVGLHGVALAEENGLDPELICAMQELLQRNKA